MTVWYTFFIKIKKNGGNTMCGRYFLDLSSNELKSYYDQVTPNATSKNIRIGYSEIFPSNHVVTSGLNQESNIVPGVTRWGVVVRV